MKFKNVLALGIVVATSLQFAQANSPASEQADCATLQSIASQIQALVTRVETQAKPSQSSDIQALFQANQQSASDISAQLAAKTMQSDDGAASAKFITKSLAKVRAEKFISDDVDDVTPMNLSDQSALIENLNGDAAVALQAVCE